MILATHSMTVMLRIMSYAYYMCLTIIHAFFDGLILHIRQ